MAILEIENKMTKNRQCQFDINRLSSIDFFLSFVTLFLMFGVPQPPATPSKNLAQLQREVCQLINISFANNELCDSVERALFELIALTQNRSRLPHTIVLDAIKPTRHCIVTVKKSSEAQKSSEIERINSQLAGFEWKKSAAWSGITKIIGSEATLTTLRIVAQDMANKLNIKIGRDEKRRKCVLIKWFSDHWDQLESILPNYSINGEKCFCEGRLLNP